MAMTPQERQLIDDLFDRLAKLENAPRDSEATSAIMQGLRRAPNAVYALVQTTLVQDEALKRANDHIEQLQAAAAGAQQGQNQPGGFLDSMRDSIFGSSQSRGSVPPVRAPEGGGRPAWNTGQAMQPPPLPPGQPQYGQPPGQHYGAPQSPFGGGGSFLGTAAAAAAGVVGGSMLMNGIRSMMGGNHQSLADTGSAGGSNSPWSSDSSNNNELSRDAGVNDIGSDKSGGDRNSFFDQASNNSNDDYDADHDSDGFDNDGGGDDGGDSDYA